MCYNLNNPAPDVPRRLASTSVKANQTITFGALADKTYGDPDFTVSATASSGLVGNLYGSGNCTVTGNSVTSSRE